MKVTYYLFDGKSALQSEQLKIAVSESRQTIWLCSHKTNYEFMPVTEKFYDNDDEKNKCIAMTEDEFRATVVKTFGNLGYKCVKIDEK